MSKELYFTDGNNEVKYLDTTASFNLAITQDGSAFDLTNATAIDVKVANDTGYVFDKSIDMATIKQPLAGLITMPVDTEVMNALVPDDYTIEVWVTLSSLVTPGSQEGLTDDGSTTNTTTSSTATTTYNAIFPSDDPQGFTITENVMSDSGDVIPVMSLDTFQQEFDQLKTDLTNKVATLQGPKGDKGDKGDTGTVDNTGLISAPAFQSLQTATTELQQNALMINPANDFNKASLLFEVAGRWPVGGAVAQSMQCDIKTGIIYAAEQTDDAGSQRIVKYNPDTKAIIQERALNLDAVVWFEGNSLYHDAVTGDVMFVLPYDLLGNWFIYNFDTDTKGTPFRMVGQTIYCIDDTGKYFVTINSKDMPGVNGYITGFNVFDLTSVISGVPKLVNYIPVKDGIVRGNNKIQGFQMVGDSIYIGRGTYNQRFRTTVIDNTGAVTADYVWDQNDIKKIIGFPDDGQVFTCESEGMSYNIVNGKAVPVIVDIGRRGSGVYYAMINLNDTNGVKIRYTSGVSVAGMTRMDVSGINRGLAFNLGSTAQDPSILDCLKNVHEYGSYNFTVAQGNTGLAPEMGSVSGIAIVREMDGYNLNKMMVIAVDYNNCTWTNYFDKGTWMQWSKQLNYVPLWIGSSKMNQPVTLNKPASGYKRYAAIYQTSNGNGMFAVGDGKTIIINCFNNGNGAAAATTFYEAQLIFPTITTARLSVNGANSLAVPNGASNGTPTMSTSPGDITIKEIWGMM